MILDFAAFDAWYEEDERNVAHPRDPFHRIDVILDGERRARPVTPWSDGPGA